MNFGQNIAYSLIAATGMTQFSGVTAAGAVCSDGLDFHGVLQSKPNTGDHITAICLGESKVLCGSGGLAAGDNVAVTTSGYFYKVASGFYAIGRCISAAASGGIANAFITGGPAYYDGR